jgi:Xaa-Pro dipeptidase
MRRTDVALAASGFDALVIRAGAPPGPVSRRSRLPVQGEPAFQSLGADRRQPAQHSHLRAGGRPKVLFLSAQRFWHKPAKVAAGPWTAALDWQVDARSDSKAGEHWAKLGRVAVIGRRAASRPCFTDPNPPELLARLHFDRAVKTPYELACMRRASALGALGHQAALAAFRRGESEYEAHMSYLEACAQREEEMPYNNIVAYNENAAVLHYQHLERMPRSRCALSDRCRRAISRLCRRHHPHLRGAARPLFAELIAPGRGAAALCGEIVAGRDYREVHLSAHRVLGDVLHAMKLIKLPGQDALERA